MTLKELMRLCYNAGREERFGNWQEWWEEFGRERYEEHLTEDAPPESAPADKEDP